MPPVYRALKTEGSWGLPIAQRVYATARGSYQPVMVGAIDRLLGRKDAAARP